MTGSNIIITALFTIGAMLEPIFHNQVIHIYFIFSDVDLVVVQCVLETTVTTIEDDLIRY